jgi:APA family basic amino acid/polyamine antiporter
VGGIAIFGCLYLFASLPRYTQVWFLIWNALGLLLYFAYSRKRSVAGKEAVA